MHGVGVFDVPVACRDLRERRAHAHRTRRTSRASGRSTCEACAPSQPPPCAASAHHAGYFAIGVGEHRDVQQEASRASACRSRRARRPVPSKPARMPSGTRCRAGARCRRLRPRRASVRASAASRANGFSQSTCLPAAIAGGRRARACAVGSRSRRRRRRAARAHRRGREAVRDVEAARAFGRLLGVAADEAPARRSRPRGARGGA